MWQQAEELGILSVAFVQARGQHRQPCAHELGLPPFGPCCSLFKTCETRLLRKRKKNRSPVFTSELGEVFGSDVSQARMAGSRPCAASASSSAAERRGCDSRTRVTRSEALKGTSRGSTISILKGQEYQHCLFETGRLAQLSASSQWGLARWLGSEQCKLIEGCLWHWLRLDLKRTLRKRCQRNLSGPPASICRDSELPTVLEIPLSGRKAGRGRAWPCPRGGAGEGFGGPEEEAPGFFRPSPGFTPSERNQPHTWRSQAEPLV